MEIIKAFIPANIVTKSSGGDNKTPKKMVISGVALTNQRDTDGEVIDPSGMELSYFLKKGHINWDHLGHYDPEAVIGFPTKATVSDDGLLEVEAELYSDNRIAKSAYGLMKSMKAQNAPRSLGWSIEAHVIQRKPEDKMFVAKSLLTDLALTPCPKGFGTKAMVVKSFSSQAEAAMFHFNDKNDYLMKSQAENSLFQDPRINEIIRLAEMRSAEEISAYEVNQIAKAIKADSSLVSSIINELNS